MKKVTQKTKKTRERLVDAAVFLFWEKGYGGTGLAEILARAQVNSGSFYYFFESKEELLLAVLDWYQESLEPVLLAPVLAQTDDPIERIFTLLAGYRRSILMTEFGFGCPIGRLALEIDPAMKEVHNKLSANFDGWEVAVESFLKDAGERIPAAVDRKRLSRFVLSVMEGGVMLSRSHKSVDPFDDAVADLRAYFDLLLAGHKGKDQEAPVARRTGKREKK